MDKSESIREILIKPAGYWLITIIPTALTYIGIIPENKRSRFMNQFYNLIPFWVWLTIALIAFVVTILVSTNKYVNKKIVEKQNELKEFKKEFDKFKAKHISMNSRAESGGQSVLARDIMGNVINQSLPAERILPKVNIEQLPHNIPGSLDIFLDPSAIRIYDPSDDMVFSVAEFSNNPNPRTVDAKNVRAKITYSNWRGDVIGSVRGRWLGDNGLDSEMVNLLSNGKPRALYLVMKFKDDPNDVPLWMCGMEITEDYIAERHQDFRYRISDGYTKSPIVIKVELFGEGVEEVFNFKMFYDGKGKEPTFMQS